MRCIRLQPVNTLSLLNHLPSGVSRLYLVRPVRRSNHPIISIRYAKLCFGCVLKRSLSAHLMQVKLLILTFYLNGELHAVSIRKPSERMLNFWTVQFLKKQIRTEFRFSAHP